jgi:protein-tyrosine-phosphatase
VQNAGRSQIATAFARQERTDRGLEDRIEILTGGTDPADEVHDVVVRLMDEVGFDLADRTPRGVSPAELEACNVVATMGCSTLELEADVDVRDWALRDPDGADEATAREIRETVRDNVASLFDEIERSLA